MEHESVLLIGIRAIQVVFQVGVAIGRHCVRHRGIGGAESLCDLPQVGQAIVRRLHARRPGSDGWIDRARGAYGDAPIAVFACSFRM
jgi:hypothetical protein